jgi:hypothetical protein
MRKNASLWAILAAPPHQPGGMVSRFFIRVNPPPIRAEKKGDAAHFYKNELRPLFGA